MGLTTSIQTPQIKAIKKVFRRRRCELERCNQLYRPVKKEQRFCSNEHRNEYHFKSPTIRKLNDEIIRLVEKTIKKMVRPGALIQ